MRQFNFLIMSLILLTTACGFHLRGVGGLDKPLPYAAWHIQETQGLEEYLHEELKRHSVQIVPSQQADDAAVIRVLELERQRDVSVLSRIGTVAEYVLYLRVSVQVSYHGQDIGKPITVHLRRTQSYSENDLFGKQLEEETLWQAMYQDAATQIVRRLAFIHDNN